MTTAHLVHPRQSGAARSRSIDHLQPLTRTGYQHQQHQHSLIGQDIINHNHEHHQRIHSVLVHKIHHLLELPADEQPQASCPQEHSERRRSKTVSICSDYSSSNFLNALIECYSPSLYSTPSSPSLSSVDSSNWANPIPAITLSSHPTPQNIQPPSQADYHRPSTTTTTTTTSPPPPRASSSHTPLVSFSPQDIRNTIMSSPSLLPQKLSHLRSRFKPSKSAVPLNTKSQRPAMARPSPVKVPPSSVGLVIDPDSWVHSDDSESDDPQHSKDRTLVDDDEVPLSQLRNRLSGGELSSAAAAKPEPPASVQTSAAGSEAHLFSKVLKRYRSSRSLRSLCKKSPDPPASASPTLRYPTPRRRRSGGQPSPTLRPTPVRRRSAASITSPPATPHATRVSHSPASPAPPSATSLAPSRHVLAQPLPARPPSPRRPAALSQTRLRLLPLPPYACLAQRRRAILFPSQHPPFVPLSLARRLPHPALIHLAPRQVPQTQLAPVLRLSPLVRTRHLPPHASPSQGRNLLSARVCAHHPRRGCHEQQWISPIRAHRRVPLQHAQRCPTACAPATLGPSRTEPQVASRSFRLRNDPL
ncbi:hypothetical protein PTTG_05380 [Puccinia triticina 1-1 BBBD Race 1]|uniref:Uncharacterized protein n=1 Tax=Puccinia triticina (isolate 1-1 / race 1 (BBBD)) TaxID=630390 RepID=A0A180GWK1_PUCT1|nr:hypothetical protein PTTG_05380 [Puccinia triticina 1-1 BBBD Race 1]